MTMIKRVFRFRIAKVAGVTTALAAASGAHAQATLPTGVTSLFSDLTDQIELLFGLMWPLVLLVLGGFILVKMTKKVANKAT